MKVKFSQIIHLLIIIIFSLPVATFEKDIKIKSDTVEFLKEVNQISFINNVEIISNFVSISAKSAIYDDLNQVISIKGMPSSIESNNGDTLFSGTAEKILFFNDEKVHLVGNASMKYENFSISSNIIIFNPKIGKISSKE